MAHEDILIGSRLLWFLNTLSGCTHTAPVTSHQLLLVHSTLWFGNWPLRIQQTTPRLNGTPNAAWRVGWFVRCENRIRDSLFPLYNSHLYRLARSSILVCCWMLLKQALWEHFLQTEYWTFQHLFFFCFFLSVLRASLDLRGFLWYADISHSQVCCKTCQNHDEIFVLNVFTLSVYQGMRTIWVLKHTGKQVFILSCHLVPTFMG